MHIYFDSQNTQYTVKNLPVFLYAVTMLIFQIERIISSEKWFNYAITLFLKMPIIWLSQTTLNGEKKEDGLKDKKILFSGNLLKKNLAIEGCC